MAGITGFGTSISFSSGFFAAVRAVTWSGVDRKAIDISSSADSGYKAFIPAGLADPGELKVEGLYSPGTKPPITGTAESVTVTYSDSSSWSASGFLTNFESGAPYEDAVTFSATIKMTGTIS